MYNRPGAFSGQRFKNSLKEMEYTLLKTDGKKEPEPERGALKPSREAVEPSVLQLREIIDEAGDGFYETDNYGKFTDFNNSLCNVLGYPREELQGRNFARFMDDRPARKLYEAMNSVWVSHQGFSNLIWEIKDREGNPRIVELSAYLIKNHEGKKMGFRGIARDVTQKFKTMNALKESERRYEREFREGRKARKRAKNLLDFVPYPMVVFTLNGKVSYVNPAFTEVFGWALEELIGRNIPFVPHGLKEQTVEDLRRLLREKDDTIETKRITKEGRVLDVIIRGQVPSERGDGRFGELFIFRDVTEERRMERTNETLFQISRALPRHPVLEELLDYISDEVKRLLNTEGATVALFDEERNDFYFLGAAYEDSLVQQQIKTMRHPFDKSVSGRVVRTGKPVIVHDTAKEPDFNNEVDKALGLHTRNMVVIPLSVREKIAGVIIAINKKAGAFDDRDKKLLTMIGSTVALSIENARFAKELNEAYKEVSSLNRAKDRIIDHLSHELKTPVSILIASLKLMSRRLEHFPEKDWKTTYDRAFRNLERILDIQYQVGDIMRDPEYKTYTMLSFLLDQCTDELEILLAEKTGEGEIVQWMRQRIDEEFGPREVSLEEISLEAFLEERIDTLKPLFSSRKVDILTRFEKSPSIYLPSHVVQKVVDGLIRNAVENTPDGGKIELFVNQKGKGTELAVKDSGVGITPDDSKRIFEGFFPTQETIDYSSKRPFEFNAGGKGADLLRIKVFAERYGFQVNMESDRCRFILQKSQICPGSIDLCQHCGDKADCYNSGGTIFRIFFPAAPV